MKVIGIIPSRLQSSRLPRKALTLIEDMPMVVHVFKRARLAKVLDAVYVATDSTEIFDTVKQYGGEVIMTSKDHKTGTDRIAEVAANMDADIVVNIQGDEPLLNPEHINSVVSVLMHGKDIHVAVLVTPYSKKNSFSDIKAVLDLNNNILYCSRNDLPSNARSNITTMWKMCFIVPFKKEFLLNYSKWQETPLEKIEFNEYLRILENGFKIKAVPVDNAHISVDTPEDLNEVIKIMKNDIIIKQYR